MEIRSNPESLMQLWISLSSSEKSLQTSTVINTVEAYRKDQDSKELSIFKGSLTLEKILEEMIRIMLHFPKLEENYYTLLITRLKQRPDFTDQKLEAAVTNMVDTCKYQEPTLAYILNYDIQIAVLEQFELADLAQKEGPSVWERYGMIKLEGRKSPVFTLKSNIDKYNLPRFVPGEPEPKKHIYNASPARYYKGEKRTGEAKSIGEQLFNIRNLEDIRKAI